MAPSRRRTAKLGGIVAGAGTLAAAGAYLAQRAIVGRARRRPDPHAGHELQPRFDTTRRLASHDGGVLATIERGVGPTIILSHGVTLSVRTWVRQFDVLPDEGFRLVAFDHRGHGDSSLGSEGHSIDTLAWDMRSIVEGLDVRDAVLVGHSMGGIAVQVFVTRFPEIAHERVRGIVLLSTMARTPLSSVRPLQWLAGGVADHVPDLASIMSFPNLGYLSARVGFGRDPSPSHVELTREMIVACAPETSHGATKSMIGFDLSEEIVGIDLPTLVICGTADVITPPFEARRIAKLIPGARLELFPGGGHMLMLERADEINRLIAEFTREVVGEARPDAAGSGGR